MSVKSQCKFISALHYIEIPVKLLIYTYPKLLETLSICTN